MSTTRGVRAGLAALFLLAGGAIQPVLAQTESARPNLSRDVGIDQKLNAQIPLETAFIDHTGKDVRLKDYFGTRPVVLVTPFYRCQGSCMLELDGIVRALADIDFQMGKDYDVLTVSINPKETPNLAAAKKAQLEQDYRKSGAKEGWHCLVGSWDSIQALTQSIGFRFVYDAQKDQVAHAAGIQILTPQGKVSRYFFGVNYRSKDVRLALVEASQGKIGSLADKVTLYCSAFDMARGRYTPSIVKLMQVLGVATAIMVAGMILILSRNTRKPLRLPNREDSPGTLSTTS